MKATDYKTLVFDCDGVVLNSNKVKTQAFYQAALPYGEEAAQALVAYHVQNGGVSRYKKFAYFLSALIQQGASGPDLEDLLGSYATKVRDGLLQCEVAAGLHELRANTPNANWLIVSGGDQAELREVFAARDLAKLFDGGIFGSPDNKEVILSRELAAGTIQQPALFLGDSKYDFQASIVAGLDFVFLSDWSEVEGLSTWLKESSVKSIHSIKWLVYEH